MNEICEILIELIDDILAVPNPLETTELLRDVTVEEFDFVELVTILALCRTVYR